MSAPSQAHIIQLVTDREVQSGFMMWKAEWIIPIKASNRMTLRIADRFGIKDRGVLRRGKSADIVLFNRETIRDNTTIEDTGKRPDGIEYVFNNGVMIVKNGNYVAGQKPGRVIRRAG
ncbi:hypothetical protein M1O19_04445 [Dehalococcoidia bacterium]|nr:hypothetical protein [Dehalococcoidia bacterium]